ncbi:cupin domain-containing protein [Neorhizobium galegae]|uniref:cupin domain-containing protein n=1 Tax=Neorhizobium galegae TaxID=399 RepID=UPI001F15D356|nr:cupin domain-containing protein [Neorhizobium galegae]MCQ1834810.1 cupin domain-containing protein [Neorhizobium galegae]UIK05696.1 cupin domain-containing protein [Neorhizobium galegae]UIY31066.1 cupin domain-containing protein [Neorhizobium galegae]
MTDPTRDGDRPSYIRHWTEVEKPQEKHYRGDDELMGFGAALARQFGLTRLGIHHHRLPPGRRTSFPHAEELEEEFIYVIEGNPEVWLDGGVYPLKPGDSVGFPAGTGIAHTFINNTDAEVRLLVIGEANKDENRLFYPKNLDLKAIRRDWWDDAPERPLGDHDGMPDKVRVWKAGQKAAKETTGE